MRRISIALCLTASISGCIPTWSKNDKNLGLASCIMTATDSYTCYKAQNNPKNYEINPILGKRPSDSRIILTAIGIQATILTIAHFSPKWRTWILGGTTGIRTAGTISNLRLDWKEDKERTRIRMRR